MKKLVAMSAVILFIGCSSTPEAPSSYMDVDEYELELVFEFLEDEDFFMGQPFYATTDGHGNVFVADMSKMEIYMLNENAEYISTLVKRGDGPGEVNGVGYIQFAPNRDMYVHDMMQRRLSRFTFTGSGYEFHSSFIMVQVEERFPFQIFYLNDEYFVGTYNRFSMDASDDVSTRVAVHLSDASGVALTEPILFLGSSETVFVDFSGNQFPVPKPYTGRSIIAPAPDGTFIELWSDEVLINRYNAAGELLNTFGLHIPRPPVTDENREQLANSQSPITQQLVNHLPEFKSVVNHLFVATNGDIWLWVGESTDRNWLVFDADGNAIRRLTAPEGVRLNHADDTRVYGTHSADASLLGYTFIKIDE
jgi:hypothetical protein